MLAAAQVETLQVSTAELWWQHRHQLAFTDEHRNNVCSLSLRQAPAGVVVATRRDASLTFTQLYLYIIVYSTFVCAEHIVLLGGSNVTAVAKH